MGFKLSNREGQLTFWNGDTREQMIANVAAKGLPFRPIAVCDTYVDEDNDRGYSAWYWGCPRLGADGRCSDYENRPQLCHDYQAGQDGLCAEFAGIPINVVPA